MRKKKNIWLALLLFNMLCILSGCASGSTMTAVSVTEISSEKVDENTNTIDISEETTIEGKEFAMSVTCGYGKYAKYGRNMAVQAEITNYGTDFTGELQVLVPGNASSGQSKLFKKEISLAAGETKKTEIIVPVVFSTGKLTISICDEAGKKLEKTELRVNVESTQTLYIGVLSDNYVDLSYLTDTETKTFLIEADSFPENKKALEMLDILVINDFNTGIFNEKQYEALKSFVYEGGTLVIGTGATGGKSLSCFEDTFLSGTLRKTDKVKISLGSAAAVEKDILDITTEDGMAVVTENSLVLMEKTEKGKGNILLFTFDLGLENENWNTTGKAITALITENISAAKQGQLRGETEGGSSYQLRNCLEMTGSDNVPSLGRYAILLTVYLLLIVLSYFVLKKLDKRSCTWVFIPLLSVFFSLAVYLMGTDTRFSKPYVQYLTFADITEGLESETLTFSLTAPYNNAYEVSVPADYDVSIPTMNYYNYNSYDSGEASSEYDIAVGYGAEETTLGIHNHGAFEAAYFSAALTKETDGYVESSVTVSIDENGEAVYGGTVTNQLGYDLQDAVLLVDSCWYILGELKDGETKTIDNLEFYAAYSMDDIWNTGVLERAVGGEPWSQGNNSDKLRHYYALEYIFTDSYRGRLETGNRVYGFTEDKDNALIDSLGLKNSGIKVVTAQIDPVTVVGREQEYISDLADRMVVLDGDYDETYRYIHSERLEAEFHFNADEKLASLIYPTGGNPENGGSNVWGYGYYGTVNAFNYETGAYEVIFESGSPAVIKDIAPYLNDKNVLRLRFDTDEAARNRYSIKMPVLAALKEAR